MRQWSEKVRNFDKNFTTENGLFFVDCSAIHDWLLPRLNEIYEEVVTFVADEAKSLADSFCDEIKVAVEVCEQDILKYCIIVNMNYSLVFEVTFGHFRNSL